MDAKDAIKLAIDYIKEFYPIVTNPLLEEVEDDDSNNSWLITLSFNLEKSDVYQFLDIPNRTYKTVEIEKSNGNVKSMKIRQL
ncbi:MAG: hypothetical protein WC121_04730 [Candidatus Kapaibacterium sp.]